MIDLERTYKMAGRLLDCACNALIDTAGGCPDRRCVVAGTSDEFEHVNCCDGARGGQLTVNVNRIYPSRNFPDVDLGTPSNCDDPWTVVTYNIAIMRCHPVGDVQHAPSCAVLDDVALLTMVDMDAIRNGITCCLRDKDATSALIGYGYHWNLGDQSTYGPLGGCVGSNLLVQVGLPTCWEC